MQLTRGEEERLFVAADFAALDPDGDVVLAARLEGLETDAAVRVVGQSRQLHRGKSADSEEVRVEILIVLRVVDVERCGRAVGAGVRQSAGTHGPWNERVSAR